MKATATDAKTYRNPSTGTVWVMPRDAKRYRALVRRLHSLDWSCERKHRACAAFAGGPCSESCSDSALCAD